MVDLALVLIILLALSFDFVNGFHDTANAVATSIATSAFTRKQAIVVASTMNLLGALTFTGVAHAIAANIINNPLSLENPVLVIGAALVASLGWNLITWYFGLPSSSSHVLIGSLAGATIAATGTTAINFKGLLTIVQALLFSPPIAFMAGFCLMRIIHLLVGSNPSKDHCFLFFQRVAATFQAFAHGSNDAQKTMGIITLALVIGGYQDSLQVPLWVKVTSALAIAAGTSTGGWRIINTMSKRITRLEPTSGFAADLSSALTIFSATILHLPLSTTYVISSSITGVGTTRGWATVKWTTVRNIILAWMLTLPAGITLGAGTYRLGSFLNLE